MTQPSFVIVGPGAIGVLFAAILAEAGDAVALLHRNPDRAAALRRDGIRLQRGSAAAVLGIPVTADAASLPAPDFICLCVKSYDTRSALDGARPLLEGGCCPVVSLQNGLGNAEAIVERVGAGRVVCAATSCGANRLADGSVREAGRGPTRVAPFSPGAAPAAERFTQALRSAGLDAVPHADAAAVLWSKLVVNAAVNPVTALYGVPNGELLQRADLMDLAAAAAREAQAVAQAAGVRLLFADAAAEVRRACEGTADNASSMLQDLRAGRRTEVEAINGAVVAEAARRGLSAPVNAKLLARVLAATC